jgi:[ribosomal protein S5]-alanine N-acetyltransferase
MRESMTTIEPLRPDHFEQAAQWLSRPEINKWLSGEWRNSEATASILAITVRNRRNKLYLVRQDSDACGLVALAGIDLADKLAMIWYLLGEEQLKGRGIISAAVRQLARRAFSELSLESLHAWIMEDNLASRRVLEKSGFRECGRFRKAACSHGRQVDRVYFDLIP